MTIPQIENEIRILHEENNRKSSVIEALEYNLSDLRQQLEVAPSAKPEPTNTLASAPSQVCLSKFR